jgi:hypothetical protein
MSQALGFLLTGCAAGPSLPGAGDLVGGVGKPLVPLRLASVDAAMLRECLVGRARRENRAQRHLSIAKVSHGRCSGV